MRIGSEKDVAITTKVDSVSYSIGLDIGKNFKTQDIEITPEVILMGIRHAQTDTAILSQEDIQAVMTRFQIEMRDKQQTKKHKNHGK